jgi:isopenicillin N synthase-like dioxygenase
MSFIIGNVIELDYNDLLDETKDFSKEIETAYGFDGIGVLTVKNVPGFMEARQKLLPIARKFALLPEEVKEKYVHKDSFYAFGWSHGKEKLQGNFDLSKGSYYANPQYDRPVEDEELIKKYAPFIHPNVWPTDDVPEMEQAFKELGNIIVSVGKLVARQCDRYVNSKCPSYPTNKLETIIEKSLCCKGRLLHFFPKNDEASLSSDEEKSIDDFASWCGWHNDHGSLTGLTPAMYMDENGNVVKNNDPAAGLYVRSRKSELIKVVIPPSNIGFQIGETAQVHSGGLLQATPHAVRGSAIKNVSREGFAVFMEPNWDEPMNCPSDLDPSNAQSQTSAKNLPSGVPSLSSRWNPSQNFGEFSEVTLNSYY